MGTYITASGFQGRSQQTILANLVTQWQALFGVNVDVSPTGPTGQMLGNFAAALADDWEAAQEIYASYDPAQAIGAELDRICALTGVSRISAAATSVVAQLYATGANLGSVIPVGSQARRVRGAVVFSLSTSAVTITTASCQDVYVKFTTNIGSGVTASVTINGYTYSANASGTPGPALNLLCLTNLATVINSTGTWAIAAPGYVPGVAQVWNAGVLQYPGTDTVGGDQDTTNLVLRLVHPTTAFALTAYATQFTVTYCGSPGTFVCSATGPVAVNAGDISQIVTAQTGWNSVYNLAAGLIGRNVETDEQLRLRRAQAFGNGLATEQSIANAIINAVGGTTSVTVTSNRTMSTDAAGRPPKSFEVVVLGGVAPAGMTLQQAIGNAIWASQPAGIQSYGPIAVPVVDNQGNAQTVYYNTPTALTIYAYVSYTLNPAQVFPTNGDAAIQAALVAYAGTAFTVGENVYGSQMAAAVYAAVQGIGSLTITVQTHYTLNGADYVPSLTVDGNHFASLVASNIQVNP